MRSPLGCIGDDPMGTCQLLWNVLLCWKSRSSRWMQHLGEQSERLWMRKFCQTQSPRTTPGKFSKFRLNLCAPVQTYSLKAVNPAADPCSYHSMKCDAYCWALDSHLDVFPLRAIQVFILGLSSIPELFQNNRSTCVVCVCKGSC